MLRSLLFAGFLLSPSWAATVTYNFNIGWVTAAPDGYSRPVIGINGQWPIPTIEANVGDTVVVNVQNNLGNETTSLHFHGMYQQGTNAYDGPVGVAQCPIAPGSSFTYTFIANPAGTHWYHSHDRGQYPDGLRGKMIIHDPTWEASLNIDQQIYLTMSDWYHTQMPTLLATQYLSTSNLVGSIPSPNSYLFNDTNAPLKFTFQPKKRYLIRLVNVGALTCAYFHIDSYKMSVVAVDGVPVNPSSTDTILVCAGQSYDIIVVGASNPTSSVQYIVKMSTDMLTSDFPSASSTTIIGNVVYLINGLLTSLITGLFSAITTSWTASVVLDDYTLVPTDNLALYTNPTNKIHYATNQTYFSGIGTRIMVGDEPYVEPKVPSLFTALTTGTAALNASTYGPGVVPHILKSNEVVQIYMENSQPYPHPMHLHGHDFQLAGRGAGSWDGTDASLRKTPMRRDTVTIPANGYIVIRFIANNPGVWFFHCHIDWHLVGGMASTIIEAPDVLQSQQSVPVAAQGICSGVGQASSGNCAAQSGAITAAAASQQCNTIYNVQSSNMGALVSSNTK
ncbi:multicopper oxidase 1 [Massarina eburnea CBS 473.64]|uniref:Multicopper oxidase 1 n=1 Tax=Massarina eburnea CBS 473.64 TaxID=1395130 RepID=A0A6A6RTG7_9PLEO|nr:multicopper oxidase 1 [Massarina eburnea CBS 473.64]